MGNFPQSLTQAMLVVGVTLVGGLGVPEARLGSISKRPFEDSELPESGPALSRIEV